MATTRHFWWCLLLMATTTHIVSSYILSVRNPSRYRKDWLATFSKFEIFCEPMDIVSVDWRLIRCFWTCDLRREGDCGQRCSRRRIRPQVRGQNNSGLCNYARRRSRRLKEAQEPMPIAGWLTI
ncbi:hypothetical protein F5Y02DRAFT_328763 [Annulohypoxylon stygium]|nr:hypothetical protein F5Y02DRAFT_328763 [Annulohypoxylon stygium]